MISILQFSNTSTRGGVEEHMLCLLQGLHRSVFRLYLGCTPMVLKQIGPDIPDDVEVLPIELVSLASTGAALQLARFLRRKRIQIVHSHMFQSSMLASPIAKFCGVRVVIETPHIREHWRRGWLKRRFFVDRLVARTVDHYIAVSEANAAYLSACKRLPKRKITHIRQGCDLERFRGLQKRPADLKQSLGFAEMDPVLVVVGRLEAQKGHKILFQALPCIRNEFPNVRVICVGEGGLRLELERQVAELGLGDCVKFVGYRSDIRPWLAIAEMSVLPSFYEGLPLAAIESIAAGCPAVASAVDGTPEVIVDQVTGLTVPPGNPESLAGAILRLLRDPELRRRMGCEGRRRAEQFSAERFVQDTQEFYLEAWEHQLRDSYVPTARSYSGSSR